MSRAESESSRVDAAASGVESGAAAASPVATPFKRALSLTVGWLADRRVPRALRRTLYGWYSQAYDVDLDEVRLPLEEHPSFAAFFVRRLREGARTFDSAPNALPSPCDGRVQSIDRIERDTILQAKGRPYSVRELLGGAGAELDFEGGRAWTIYLSPRDYHRVHSPLEAGLSEARWLPGARHSVAPAVLAARPKVFSINERVVMRLETERGPLMLVMVGALNVGRIRVVGVEPGERVRLDPPRRLARGDELARFELGSTVILVAPASFGRWRTKLEVGAAVRMGEAVALSEA